MQNLKLVDVKARIKSLLLFYIPCLVVLVIVCLAIYDTSNYYAAAYPYSNITALPHNSTTTLLSIFNGYSEKVPFNGNQTTIMQRLSAIKQEAETSVNATIEELGLAFIVLFLFSLLYVFLDRSQNKKPYLLPIIFLFVLLVSQYIAFADYFLVHKTVSGISLFFVDSLATIIWFGIVSELLLAKFIKNINNLPRVKKPAQLSRSNIALKVLMVLWPVILIAITFTLFQNLGLLAYNGSFLSTYIAHSLGLFSFIFLFGWIFYLKETLAIIRRIGGS